MCNSGPARFHTFYLIASAALLAMTAQNALGQTGRAPSQPISRQILGQVRFAPGNQPAFNVMVSCDSFGHGFIGQETTDRNGKFQFSGLGADQYVITIRVPGYIEERQETELYTTPSQYLQFRLNPEVSKSGVSPPAVLDISIPEDARKEFEKAEALLRTGRKESIEEGISHLQAAIGIYPRFTQAQLKLGTAYMDLHQWDKAEQALKKTLEIDPRAANARFALGEIYLHQKKYEQSEKSLQDGFAIDSHSAPAHLTLARVYWERTQGIKDEALWKKSLESSYKEVNQALQLDPVLASAHLLKGDLYLRARRGKDALHEFEEYLRLDPRGEYAEQTRALAEKLRKALAEEKKP
jgi:tetratricopeptide (TPR) repeat protein